MKILLLTRYSRLGASSRLRSLQYVDALRGGDIEFEVSPLLNDAYVQTIYAGKRISMLTLISAYSRRLAILGKARNFDIIWIEKELFPNLPSIFEKLLPWFGVSYIVDYDDAIFHNYDRSPNPLKRLLKRKIGNVMRRATLVTVGNSYLKRHAMDAGASNIVVLPTVIDILRYPIPAVKNDNARLVIGWIGSPATVKFLRLLLPVMERLAKSFAFDLAVIGAKVDTTRYEFVRNIDWQEATEAMEIGRFDIGVMPLPDEPWERGKCAYKLIQYMACGKPVVASPVGMNTDVVQEGINGFLAGSDDAWFHALSRLLSDAELRQSMGQQGRKLVEEKYCLQVTAPRLRNLFEQVVAGKRGEKCAA